MVVPGERHLRHDNEVRTHLTLDKYAPVAHGWDRRSHFLPTGLGRTASSVCPDLIYDRHRPFAELTKRRLKRVGVIDLQAVINRYVALPGSPVVCYRRSRVHLGNSAIAGRQSSTRSLKARSRQLITNSLFRPWRYPIVA